jgi:hypothetical protein
MCMECCTESLYAHPMRDEVCSHVCHTASGLPVPRPPTPPKRWAPTDRSAARRHAYAGPLPPYYKGRFSSVGGGGQVLLGKPARNGRLVCQPAALLPGLL